MDYEKMLADAYENMPSSVTTRERFEIPKATGFLEGNRTVVKNFGEISKKFSRDVDHFQKFLLKELATPGTPRNDTLILGRKVQPALINEKIKKYADLYVICPECGKPDTTIKVEKDGSFLSCQACGSKTKVKELV
jgi:translation initiation factor 2 subunit 2